MRHIVLIIAILTTISVRGQIINNVSPDRTNIYFHAVDSLTKILKKTERVLAVVVYGDLSTVSHLPDSVDGLMLVKKDISERKRVLKTGSGNAMLTMGTIQIIRDQFSIRFTAYGQHGRLAEGQYIFFYKYMPDTQTFELTKIKSGIVL